MAEHGGQGHSRWQYGTNNARHQRLARGRVCYNGSPFAGITPGAPTHAYARTSHHRRHSFATAPAASRPPRRGLRHNRPLYVKRKGDCPPHIAADYRHGGIPERLQEYKKRAITACELFSPGQCSFLLCWPDMRYAVFWTIIGFVFAP